MPCCKNATSAISHLSYPLLEYTINHLLVVFFSHLFTLSSSPAPNLQIPLISKHMTACRFLKSQTYLSESRKGQTGTSSFTNSRKCLAL